MFTAIKHLFRLQFVLILIAVFAGIYVQEIIDKFQSTIFDIVQDTSLAARFGSSNGIYLFTKEELAKFTGQTDNNPIYLSILGSVYDVTKGRKHYGPGCSYSYFAGRDATKSFITGEFDNYNSESDDVMSLSPNEILSLYEWKRFYEKEYTFKGLVIGRFFDKKGKKTKYHYKLDALVEQSQLAKQKENEAQELFPQCNIEWSEKKGTRVWCSDRSGGKKRDWVGVPRKYYEPGNDIFRCACVQELDLNSPHLKPYDDCDNQSHTCYYKID